MNFSILFIFFFYILFLLVDHKRTVLLYIVIKPLLSLNIAIIGSPGLPLITLDVAIILVTLVVLVFRKVHLFSDFPLRISFVCFLISCALTLFFCPSGIVNLTRIFSSIFYDWIYLCIFWGVVREEKDARFVLRGYICTIAILCFYGIVEKILGINPIMALEATLISDPSKQTLWMYDNVRLGMGRIQSFMSHPITYGGILSILSLLFFYVFSNMKLLRINPLTKGVFFLLLIMNILFTNSRSPILFLLVGALGMIHPRQKSFYKYALALLVFSCIIAAVFYQKVSVYAENVTSIFELQQNEEVGGSSIEMRQNQMLAVVETVTQSPWMGLGPTGAQDYLGRGTAIMGAESCWFQALLFYGVIGVIAYIVLIVDLIRIRVKGEGRFNQFAFFLVMGWLAFSSATGEMGTRYMAVGVLLLLYRMHAKNAHMHP